MAERLRNNPEIKIIVKEFTELLNIGERFVNFIMTYPDWNCFAGTEDDYKSLANRCLDKFSPIMNEINLLFKEFLKTVSAEMENEEQLLDFNSRLVNYIIIFICNKHFQLINIMSDMFKEKRDPRCYTDNNIDPNASDDIPILHQFNIDVANMTIQLSTACIKMLKHMRKYVLKTIRQFFESQNAAQPSVLPAPPVGGSLYYHKYMKYKNKYKQLKHH